MRHTVVARHGVAEIQTLMRFSENLTIRISHRGGHLYRQPSLRRWDQ